MWFHIECSSIYLQFIDVDTKFIDIDHRGCSYIVCRFIILLTNMSSFNRVNHIYNSKLCFDDLLKIS